MATLQLKPAPNFDLLPKNPRPGLIECKDTKVNVTISVDTKKPSSAKVDRWEKVATQEMERYRGIIEDTVAKVTAKWEKGSPAKTPKELSDLLQDRERSAGELTRSINQAIQSLKGAVEKAVETQIKREAKGDQNLLEAKISVAMKGTITVVAIGTDIMSIVATGGANVKAIVSLCKDVYTLAKLVYDQCKDEAKHRDDLFKAIATYTSTKQLRWDEEKKAKDWKDKLKLIAKKIYASEKSLADKAEAARKKYRNEVVTKLTQKVDDLGAKRDALLAELKKSARTDLKGIRDGTQMVKLGAEIKAMNSHILACQKFIDDMAFLLTEAGVEVSDKTAKEKLQSFDFKQIADGGKQIAELAYGVYSAVEAAAKLA